MMDGVSRFGSLRVPAVDVPDLVYGKEAEIRAQARGIVVYFSTLALRNRAVIGSVDGNYAFADHSADPFARYVCNPIEPRRIDEFLNAGENIRSNVIKAEDLLGRLKAGETVTDRSPYEVCIFVRSRDQSHFPITEAELSPSTTPHRSRFLSGKMDVTPDILLFAAISQRARTRYGTVHYVEQTAGSPMRREPVAEEITKAILDIASQHKGTEEDDKEGSLQFD